MPYGTWDLAGYEPDLPDYDESDRHEDRPERTCHPTLGEPCGECLACGGEGAEGGEGGEE